MSIENSHGEFLPSSSLLSARWSHWKDRFSCKLQKDRPAFNFQVHVLAVPSNVCYPYWPNVMSEAYIVSTEMSNCNFQFYNTQIFLFLILIANVAVQATWSWTERWNKLSSHCWCVCQHRATPILERIWTAPSHAAFQFEDLSSQRFEQSRCCI